MCMLGVCVCVRARVLLWVHVPRPSMNSIFMFFGAVGLLVFAVMWVPVHYTPHLCASLACFQLFIPLSSLVVSCRFSLTHSLTHTLSRVGTANDWHFGMVEFMIVLFMILNVFGRLAMTSLMQTELTGACVRASLFSSLPLFCRIISFVPGAAENNGAIIGLRGTFVKLTASGLRALLGIAFSATGEDGFLSFVIFSGVLALFALIQIIFSFLLGKTSLPSSAGDPELRHKRAYRSMTIVRALPLDTPRFWSSEKTRNSRHHPDPE